MEPDERMEKGGGRDSEADPRPKYDADFRFVQLLVSGEAKAWDRFYKQLRKSLNAFIHARHPDMFTDIAAEEICDGVQSRLTGNQYNVLRQYRGDCKFSTYVTRQTEWEIKDWLRKHSQELLCTPLGGSEQEEECAYENSESGFGCGDAADEIPESVKALSNELRWAFLLRYYDYFGFPLSEVRLLAKTRAIPIRSVVARIINFLEPEGKDALGHQREKDRALRNTIEALCYRIHKLNMQEQKLLRSADDAPDADRGHADQIDRKLGVIKSDRLRLENRRKALINSKSSVAVATPYEIVGEILGESNLSTVRSRVFLARKQLAEKLKKEAARQFT